MPEGPQGQKRPADAIANSIKVASVAARPRIQFRLIGEAPKLRNRTFRYVSLIDSVHVEIQPMRDPFVHRNAARP